MQRSHIILLSLLACAWLTAAPIQARTSIPIMRTDELRPGMRGYGKTVFKGTQVVQFPIVVLGVIKGYLSGNDLILIRVTGGYPAEHGVGIIAGMSGSPVYVNGRLIGALAYGWAFSKEPIGGVTPIQCMLGDLPQPRGKAADRARAPLAARPLPHPIAAAGRRLKRVQILPDSDAARHAAPDTLALTPVASLFQVSGFGPRRFQALKALMRPLNLEPVQTFAAAGPVPRRAPRLVPGSALGVELLSGDLQIAGTGTVTYVDGNRFLAFGHPLAQLGDVQLPVSSAYIQDVLPSYQRPFKFASQIGPAGELSTDRFFAVGGYLGRRAPMIPVHIHVRDVASGLSRTFNVRSTAHRLLAPSLITQAVMESLSTMTTGAEATARLSIHVQPHGHEPLHIEQMVAGQGVDTGVALQFLEFVNTLSNNDFAPVALDRVDVNVTLTAGRRTAIIEKVYATRNDYRRGDHVDVHVVLRPYAGHSIEKVVQVPVPPDMDKGSIVIGVAGGTDMMMLRKRLGQPRPEATSLPQLLRQMAEQERNQQIVVRATYPSRSAVVGEDRFLFLPESLRELLPGLPQSNIGVDKDYFEARLDTDYVIRGTDLLQADLGGAGAPAEKPKAPSLGYVSTEGPGAEPALQGPLPSAMPRSGTAPAPKPAVGKAPAAPLTDKAFPSGTRRWDLQGAAILDQGQFEGTGRAGGELVLAPAPHITPSANGEFLWSMAPTAHGDVLAGSSGGRVFRYNGGATQELPAVGDNAVTAVAVASDGALWMGTAPYGTIYRAAAPGEAPARVHAGERYVWCLVSDGDGAMVAGTGYPAKVYRIAADGTTKLLQSFAARHVRALLRETKGDLLVATASPGAVYRLHGDGAPQLLFSTQYPSVDALAVSVDGAVVAASGKLLYSYREGQPVLAQPVGEKPLLAMAMTADGEVLTAGGGGGIYRTRLGGATVRVADLDGRLITALASAPDGSLVATAGGPGGVVRLGSAVATEGTWTSDVLDAGAPARWGRIRWLAQSPEGGHVSVQTRSGYTGGPDASWSDWSAPYGNADGQDIASPRGRYLQVRARLGGGSATPRLTGISIYYRAEEQAPMVEIDRPAGGERWAGSVKLQWKVSGGSAASLAYALSYSADGGKTFKDIKRGIAPGLKEQPGGGQTAREDAPLSEEFTWDTRRLPDGEYRVRVEVLDRTRTPMTVRSSALSAPLVLANTEPSIHVVRRDTHHGTTVLHGVARSHLAYVVSVAYRVGGGEWQIATADDGMFDSDQEKFTITASGGGDVEIKVTDEAGNHKTVHEKL